MAPIFYFQYLVIPFIFLLLSPHIPKFLFFPILWVWAYVNFVALSGNKSVLTFFKSVFGMYAMPKKQDVLPVIFRFVVLFTLISVAMYNFFPEDLFSFPRRAPIFWLIVMCLYPLLSVIPQGFIWRYSLYESGKDMTPKQYLPKILFGALLFSLVHIIFKNPVALVATFLGGMMFCQTYIKSKSLLLSNIEHALYGQMIFTVGLGKYLYLVN